MRHDIDSYRDRLAPGSPYPTPAVAPTAADSLPLLLRGLPVAARVLMVGIHPDDEDSALLAELALRHGVHTVYLSLTRGEGGQNRIGPESGTAFGILRTGELLASRQHDGAEQLLGPCIDFGYAKRAEDAFGYWGRENVIAAVVQAIREVQPDVLISIWTGTPIDGHGHHQACGIATHAAFALAADATAFPEQIQAGLAPWQARRLMVRVRDASQWVEGDLPINVGRWDPVLGRSCFEVAMQGRSLHRSQNMGTLQLKGAQHVVYRVVAGTPVRHEQGANPLTDLPVRLDAWVQEWLDGHQPSVREAVETAPRLLDTAWETYHPQHPDQTAAYLLQALGALTLALRRLKCPEEDAAPTAAPDVQALRHRLQAHSRKVASAWLQARGLTLEVLAPQPQVVAGETLEVEAELFVRGLEATTLQSLQVHLHPGWQAECLEGPEYPMRLDPGTAVTARFLVHAPEDEETAIAATLLPWLHLPSEGNLYRFPGALPSLAPCAPPLLTVEAVVQAGDVHIPIVAPVLYREADPGFGEVRQPVRVVPAVTVEVSPNRMVLPASTTAAPEITVMLRSQKAERGRLVLRSLEAGSQDRYELKALRLPAMGLQTLHQELPMALDSQGTRTYRVEWERDASSLTTSSALSYCSVQDVRFPHIEPGYMLVPAQFSVTVVAVAVEPDLTIGYVPGTGDAVPEALACLGLTVETLDDVGLQFGNLDKFDTIMVGVRALETRPLVAAYRERLWQYARSGGTLIVQYQKPREDGPARFVPFPDVSMPRPVPRVSNENATVRLLAPDNPILTFPNRIGADDFAGWVQERGLYFLTTWPQELCPLLECADDGEPPRRGGLLHTRLGAGHYVYCAYALFRQLPAGVPGAYRLLANLVSLPRSAV